MKKFIYIAILLVFSYGAQNELYTEDFNMKHC